MSYPKAEKETYPAKEKIARILFTVLFSTAAALILLLAVGTIIGLVRPRHAEPLLRLGNAATEQAATHTGDTRVFSGLGRLRIPLADSSVMLLSIAFPYPADDIAFSEELAGKISDFRVIATGYFSSLSPSNLIQINEEAAKQEILRRYNASLRLGRIEVLYFSDMMVLEASY